MAETWLQSNRRVLAFGLIMPVATLILSVLLALWFNDRWGWLFGGIGALVAIFGGVLVARLACLPRLAFADRHLLVYLESASPYRVPIEVVEGFLLGQGPTMLPGKRYEHAEAKTLVIRLAESATDWADRETKPALGRWCGSYITLRGTWCEPLSVELVNRLNQRLYEVSHEAGAKVAGNRPGSER
jgi:hypothetical protein